MYQSVGVIEDTISLLAAVRTFTHELGHAFGAEHDGIVGCDADKYVMAAGVQIEPGPIQEQWSDCSKNYIRDFLKDGAADCLLNAPVTYMNGSRCGDGFVTGDEECDSGHTPDACCTAECKLTTGSQCSSIQDCCTPQCQFKKAGAVCREGAHSCDLPDYCSGDTAVCTEDLVRQSGKPCETYLGVASKGGVCHRGTCRSADRQCNNLFNFLAVGFSTTHCESVQKEKGAWKEKTNPPCTTVCIVLLCALYYCVHCVLMRVSFIVSFASSGLCGSLYCNPPGKVDASTCDVLNMKDSTISVDEGTACGDNMLCVAGQCSVRPKV